MILSPVAVLPPTLCPYNFQNPSSNPADSLPSAATLPCHIAALSLPKKKLAPAERDADTACRWPLRWRVLLTLWLLVVRRFVALGGVT